MSKPLKIVLVVVAVLAVLGGGYYFMNKDDDASNSTSSGEESSQASEESTEAGTESEASFASINSSGKPQQCTFEYSGATGTGTGKMFADGKGRGRMTLSVSTEQGNTGETNTLVTTDKAYTWFTSDGQTMGFMYDKTTFEANSGSNQTSSSSGTDPNQNFTMNCKSWTVDESVLTAPSDVNFTSFPSM